MPQSELSRRLACSAAHSIIIGHAAACMVHTVCKSRPGQCSQLPVAAYAQHAARLLGKLCVLVRVRRSGALLDRRLRLSARLCARLVYLNDVCDLVISTVWRLRSLQKQGCGQCSRLQHDTISCAPAWRAPRAHAPAPPQRAPQLLPPPQRAPRCALGSPRLKHFISQARHILRGRHALPLLQLNPTTRFPMPPFTRWHVHLPRSAPVAHTLCPCTGKRGQGRQLPRAHAQAREGRTASCRARTAGCAPACQAPRARAPAPQQSAPQLTPPPQRAPQCVLGAPGPVHYIRQADVKGMLAFARPHHHKPCAAMHVQQ